MTTKYTARPWFNLARHNDPPVPPAPPAVPPAPPAPPANPPADPPNPDEPLGENGIKALQQERAARQAAEAEAALLRKAEEDRQLAEKSELEQAQARQAAAEKTAADALARSVKSEVKALADGFADKEDAVLNLGDLSQYVKNGEVAEAAITAALADVLTRKPHLAKANPGPRPPAPDDSQGRGGTPGATTDFRTAEKADFDKEMAKYGLRPKTR